MIMDQGWPTQNLPTSFRGPEDNLAPGISTSYGPLSRLAGCLWLLSAGPGKLLYMAVRESDLKSASNPQ